MSMMPPPAGSSHAYNSSPYLQQQQQQQQQQASGPSNYQQHNTNGVGLGLSASAPVAPAGAGALFPGGSATPSSASGHSFPQSTPAVPPAAANLGSLYPPGASILRLMQLYDAMVGKGAVNELEVKHLEYWRRFVREFFVSDGYFRQVFWNPQAGEQRAFELPVPALARYLHTIYLSGVESRNMVLSQAKEYPPHSLRSIPNPPETKRAVNGLPNARTTHFVQVNRARMSLEYETGWMVVHSGLLRAALTSEPAAAGTSLGGASLKFQFVDFHITDQESFVPKARISRSITEQPIPDDIVAKIRGTSSEAFKRDVKREKRDREENQRGLLPGKGDDDNDQQDPDGRFVVPVDRMTLPEAPVNEYGITLRAMRCLEITESVCQLRSLMDYAAQQDLGPLNALHRLAEDFRSAQSNRSGLGVNGSTTHANGQASSDELNRSGTGRSPMSTSGSGGVDTLNTSPSSSGGGGSGGINAGGGGGGDYEGANGGAPGSGPMLASLKRRSNKMDAAGSEDIGGMSSPIKRPR